MTTASPQSPRTGLLVVISGPSGVGKTVLCSRMVERFAPDMVYSISATTRAPRSGERHGREYFFYPVEEFRRAIEEDRLAEWALVHGNYYGTPRDFLEANRAQGRHVLMNIDVQGGMKIRAGYPDALLFFLRPPSLAALEERIRKRGVDSDETVRRRLENAHAELAQQSEYTYVVVNDDLDTAARELEGLIRKHILSRS